MESKLNKESLSAVAGGFIYYYERSKFYYYVLADRPTPREKWKTGRLYVDEGYEVLDEGCGWGSLPQVCAEICNKVSAEEYKGKGVIYIGG